MKIKRNVIVNFEKRSPARSFQNTTHFSFKKRMKKRKYTTQNFSCQESVSRYKTVCHKQLSGFSGSGTQHKWSVVYTSIVVVAPRFPHPFLKSRLSTENLHGRTIWHIHCPHNYTHFVFLIYEWLWQLSRKCQSDSYIVIMMDFKSLFQLANTQSKCGDWCLYSFSLWSAFALQWDNYWDCFFCSYTYFWLLPEPSKFRLAFKCYIYASWFFYCLSGIFRSYFWTDESRFPIDFVSQKEAVPSFIYIFNNYLLVSN